MLEEVERVKKDRMEMVNAKSKFAAGVRYAAALQSQKAGSSHLHPFQSHLL